MTSQRHGIAIGIDCMGDEVFLTLRVYGTLTHEDYQTITPMIDGALAQLTHPRVKALIDARELDGWELRAAWDDFKLGLKHGNEFVKVAIVGNKRWQGLAAKVGSWFISGDMAHFDGEATALEWLQQD